MLIPVSLDVPFDRKPFVNWLLIASIVGAFILEISAAMEGGAEAIKPYLLDSWSLKQMLTSMWMHGDLFHLLGNMLFLWLFGNAICAKMGNLMYLPTYLIVGIVGGISHLITSDVPVLGASGAINGIVGMYLIMYPVNDITCFYWFGIICRGTFTVSGYWMILLWFGFDILGLTMGGGNVAYAAHVGGFISGVAIAIVLLKTRVIEMDPRFETSIFDLIAARGNDNTSAGRRNNYYDYEAARNTVTPSADTDPLPFAGGDQLSIATAAPPPDPNPDLSDDDFFQSAAPAAAVATPLPEPKPEVIRFRCHCGQKIKVPLKYSGKTGKCPGCKGRVKIPVV